MTRPTVTTTAEELYDGLAPWTAPDEGQNWHLLLLADAATRNLEVLNQLVRDTDDYPGWSQVMDPDRASLDQLPWLGQFVGVTVDTTLSEVDQREQVKQTQGFKRGTVQSLISAAKPYLTGTQAVIIEERDTSAYHFTVATFSAETPDPGLVEAALITQKPAGLMMDYVTRDGLTYAELAASGKTYAELDAEFATSRDMKFAESV